MKNFASSLLPRVAVALIAALTLHSAVRADTWTVESGLRSTNLTSTATVQLSDGSYRHYYHGNAYRTSPDGVTFSSEKRLNLSTPSGYFDRNPAIIVDSTGWVMLYERIATANQSTVVGIYRFTSSDGLTWTADTNPVMTPNTDEGGFISVPGVVSVNATTTRMYYVIKGDVVASATTTDRGVTWTREGKITVNGLLAPTQRFVDPCVIKTAAGHYRLFLSVVAARLTNGIGNQSIYAAASGDGRTFYLEPTPKLGVSDTTQSLLDPDVVAIPGGGYRVYYGDGPSSQGPFDLKSATTPLLGTPAMTSVSATTGTVDTAFSFTLTGSNSPDYFAVASGTLPTGLSLNPVTGVISGTPTAIGASTFTVTAANSYAVSAAQSVTITIAGNARLANLSIRANVTAAQKIIVGFYVSGGAKSVLIRGIGPGLAPFLASALAGDPKLQLYNSASTLVDSNDNWGGGTTLSTAFASVGAFALTSTSADAALVKSVDGSHSVHFSATSTGVGLVELYDSGSGSTQRLTNVSALYQAGTGSAVLIAGFNITGSGTKNILVRGIGPALTQFGVAGALADPRLEVFDSAGKSLSTNDDWSSSLSSAFTQVGAFALTAASKDAALSLALTAGTYSVQLSGATGTTGQALIELYEVP